MFQPALDLHFSTATSKIWPLHLISRCRGLLYFRGSNFANFIVIVMKYLTLIDPVLVIIEYALYGDLLGYLRMHGGLTDNRNNPQPSLTSQQLMKFSLHIAEGMSYLSSRNVSLFCRKRLSPFLLSLKGLCRQIRHAA